MSKLNPDPVRVAADEHHIKQARAAQATARIAIRHLQAVLNKECSSRVQQAARDWLISIGSDAAVKESKMNNWSVVETAPNGATLQTNGEGIHGWAACPSGLDPWHQGSSVVTSQEVARQHFAECALE